MKLPSTSLVAALGLVAALSLSSCSDSGSDEQDPAAASTPATSTETALDQVGQLVQTGIEQANSGDLETAEATFNNVLVLDPGNQFAYYNLGVIAQTDGKDDRAIRFYDSALETAPDYTPALFNKAIILEPDDLQGAVDIYEQIIEIDPDASTTFLRLSFAYEELGDQARADESRARAIELDPSLAEITELPAP